MNSSQLVAALGCLQEILSVQSSGLATGSVANNSQMAPTSFSKAAPAKVSAYIIYFVHVPVTNISLLSLLQSVRIDKFGVLDFLARLVSVV